MLDMTEDRERDRDRGRRSDRGSRFDDSRDRDRSRETKNCRRVYVSNIPYEFRWQDLKDLFRKEVGEVAFVELFNDENNKPRGCGIVEFDKPESVGKCLEKMNRHEINGRNLVIKEDYGNERDKYGRVIPKGSGNNGGGGGDRFRDRGDRQDNYGRNDRNRDDDRHSLGGGGYDGRAFETYGLSLKFLEGLGIQGPLHTKVFVANLDYKVDVKKLKQVFKMAGRVHSVDLATDKDGSSRGFAVVEYEHPVEAIQAISMFDRQQLYERRMTVRLDRVPDKSEGPRLPEGLKGIGLGLGQNGEPLRNVTSNLPSLQSNLNSVNNSAPAPVQPPSIASAASLLASQPNLTSNLAALSTLSGLTGVGALTNSVLSSAAASLGLGLGNANDLSSSSNNPAFSTSASNFGNSVSGGGRGGNDFDLGVRSYSTSNDDFGGGRSFNNGRDSSRASDTIIIRNLPVSWTWQHLRDKFRDVGEVKFAEIRGEAGVVRFANQRDAEVAIKLMNGSRFDGRMVDIDYF